jgi:hypothetical protein
MTLEEYITAAEIAFEKFLTCVGSVPPPLLAEPMTEGKWSVRDLAAHFIYWEDLALRALEAVYMGNEPAAFPFENPDTVNAEAVAAQRTRKPERVLSELRITHSAVMEAAGRVPRAKLCPQGEVPEWLVRVMLTHYTHHLPQIEEWVERMKREGKTGLSELRVKN